MKIFNRRDLGNQLRAWRITKGYSMKYVAEQIQVSREMISVWENGFEYPKQEELDKLCDFFGKERIYITPKMREIAKNDHLKEFLKEMKDLYFFLEDKNWTHITDTILDSIYGNLPIPEIISSYKNGLREIGFIEIEDRHNLNTYGFRCKTSDGMEYFIEFMPTYQVVLINEEESTIEMNSLDEQLQYVKEYIERQKTPS